MHPAADTGCHISQIIDNIQGHSEGEVRNAINELSNEGHIYSTIDENTYQHAE